MPYKPHKTSLEKISKNHVFLTVRHSTIPLKSEPEPVRNTEFFLDKKKSKFTKKNPLEFEQLEDPNGYEIFTSFRENYSLSNGYTLGSESCENLEHLEHLAFSSPVNWNWYHIYPS